MASSYILPPQFRVKIYIEGTGFQLETKLRTVLYTQRGILLIYGLSGNSYLSHRRKINIHCNYQLFPTREFLELTVIFTLSMSNFTL